MAGASQKEFSEPLVVPVPAAARRLGWGRDRTYEMVRDGRIPSVKIGRRRLVPVVALQKVVDEEVARSNSDGRSEGAARALRPFTAARQECGDTGDSD